MSESGSIQFGLWRNGARRGAWAKWLCLAALLLMAGASKAQSPYQLKAAVMVNIAKFVQWPTNVFADSGVALRIGIFGEDPFGADLEKIVEPVHINGRNIVILRSDRAQELSSCQIVYFSAKETKRFDDARKAFVDKPVLLLGERPDFLEKGGMVSLEIEDRKVKFEVNLDVVEREGLSMNAQLLRLASKVRRSGGRK